MVVLSHLSSVQRTIGIAFANFSEDFHLLSPKCDVMLTEFSKTRLVIL